MLMLKANAHLKKVVLPQRRSSASPSASGLNAASAGRARGGHRFVWPRNQSAPRFSGRHLLPRAHLLLFGRVRVRQQPHDELPEAGPGAQEVQGNVPALEEDKQSQEGC
jgi:hypothetical protein